MSTDGVGGAGNTGNQVLTDVNDNFAKEGTNDKLINAAGAHHKSALDELVSLLNAKDKDGKPIEVDPGAVEKARERVDGARRIMIAISELSRAGHEMLMALIRKLSLN